MVLSRVFHTVSGPFLVPNLVIFLLVFRFSLPQCLFAKIASSSCHAKERETRLVLKGVWVSRNGDKHAEPVDNVAGRNASPLHRSARQGPRDRRRVKSFNCFRDQHRSFGADSFKPTPPQRARAAREIRRGPKQPTHKSDYARMRKASEGGSSSPLPRGPGETISNASNKTKY